MRVLLAFDKFKDALSAERACLVAAEALQECHRDWELDLCPFTDGGEGFAAILVGAARGETLPVVVSGPRGQPVTANLGLVAVDALNPAVVAQLNLPPGVRSDALIGIIEMAAASGLALLPASARDPWLTSSVGTGELIQAAHRQGCRALLLGVGGSATNDLGLGALVALGVECLDHAGAAVCPPTPATWHRIARLRGKLPADLPAVRIACDVSNPLLGPQGCAAAFGPQKGLRPDDLDRLELAGARMARLLCTHFDRPESLAAAPGSGAAGGIAFGLAVAAGAQVLPGAGLVAEWLELDRRILEADIVVTGEGRFDQGTLHGKGPGAIVSRAESLGREVHLFAGSIDKNIEPGNHIHAITPPGLPLAMALAETTGLLRAAVLRQFR